MDFNDEVERLLRSLDQRQEEFNKEALGVFREFAKEMKKMSSDQRRGMADQAKETKLGRLRDEARSKRSTTTAPSAEEARTEQTRLQAAKNLANAFKGAGTRIDAFTANVATASDNLNDLNGALRHLPFIGALLGGAFAGLIINGIQTTIDSFRQLNKQGVVFGDSILDINMAAVRAGMGLTEFSDLVAKNASAVNRFGLDNIMDINSELNETSSVMRQMGLTTKEITTHLLDYMEYQRLAGTMGLNDKMIEAAQASKLARIIDDLALATGESIEAIRGKMLETIDNSRFKMLVAGMEDEQRDALTAFTGAMKGYIPELENILADLSVGGSNLTNNLPFEVQNILGTLLQDMDTKKAEAALRQWADMVSEDQTNIWQSGIRSNDERSKIAADLWSNLSRLNDPKLIEGIDERERARREMSLLNDTMQRLREAALLPIINAVKELDAVQIEAISGALDKLSTALGGLLASSLSDENIDRFNKFIEDVSNGDFSALGESLVGVAKGLITTAFGEDALTSLSEAVTNTTNAINKVADFWNAAVSNGGIIAAGLTTAFSLLAASMIAGGGRGGGVGPRVAAAGTGGLGSLVGGQFMRSFNAAGIGMTLAGVVIDGIQGEVDNGTWGSVIGLGIGTGVGAFFGGPAGAALGANIGGFLGGAIGDVMEQITGKDSEMVTAMRAEADQVAARIATSTSPDEIIALKAQQATINDNIETQRSSEAAESSRLNATKDALQLVLNNFSRGLMISEANLSTDQKAAYEDIFQNNMDMASPEQVRNLQNAISELATHGSGQADSVYKQLDEAGALYAEGGIATRPSIFGEAGAEAAIPLDNGMRIPIAEVDVKGMEDIQRNTVATAQMNSQLIEVMTSVRQSLDKFINYTMINDKTKEQIEVLLGIYEKLDSIDGSNDGILRNSRASI